MLKVLTCDIGGQWSGRTPQCRYVDCGAPAQISHGTVKLINGSTTVGSRIEYSCEEDFEISGDVSQECTIDGKWGYREKPQCYSNYSYTMIEMYNILYTSAGLISFVLVISCDEPEVSKGSYVTTGSYDYFIHSTIEYHCDPGYLLHGEPKRTCDHNGEWTGDLPYCECKR